MDRQTITIDPTTTKLRRVGRVARRRMRIDGDALRNGTHTDGTLSVEISGLGSPVAGVPDLFEWQADRPIALVIVRTGIDGEDVSFDVGPAQHGIGRSSGANDGSGIRYVAFCYDAPVESTTVRPTAPAPAAAPAPARATAASVADEIAAIVSSPVPASVAATVAGSVAARPFAPTHRERRSILSLLLRGVRRSTSTAPA
jgi:hypothetical protein